jgi:hypothetical protein
MYSPPPNKGWKKVTDHIPEPKTKTIAETANLNAWTAEEPDGETTFHLELNNLTVHFFEEEWREFLDLAQLLVQNK